MQKFLHFNIETASCSVWSIENYITPLLSGLIELILDETQYL